jgi:hypothetical protein
MTLPFLLIPYIVRALTPSMAAKGLRSFHPLNRCLQTATTKNPAILPRHANMSTIASFKIPKISNEPNVSVAHQLVGYRKADDV